MTPEVLVSKEAARLLSLNGFDEFCDKVYRIGECNNVDKINITLSPNDSIENVKADTKVFYWAPTQQRAVKWMHESKNVIIDVQVKSYVEETWTFYVYFGYLRLLNKSQKIYNNPEEATNDALCQALKFIKRQPETELPPELLFDETPDNPKNQEK